MISNDSEPAPHTPNPTCYVCRGTGVMIGFGSKPGTACPCLTIPEEY